MKDGVFPFRWDVARREQLGRLVTAPVIEPFLGFREELRLCCARVIARAGDARLIFVGRSPETLFDYLSGLLRDTTWRERLTLLQFSMHGTKPGNVLADDPPAVMAYSEYLRALSLDPKSIGSAQRPIAFVDLVASGETFGNLTELLRQWASEIAFDWRSVQRRLRYIGITERLPRSWRWTREQEWRATVPDATMRTISLNRPLWDFLGNRREKATERHGSWRWNDPSAMSPSRSDTNLVGLAIALTVFDWGSTLAEREDFARLLAREPAMAEGWLRHLVGEIRGRRPELRRKARRGKTGGDRSYRMR